MARSSHVSVSVSAPEPPAWVAEAVSSLPPLATVAEVGALLRISRRTVERYLASGEITAASRGVGGHGRVLIPRGSVADYLARLQTRSS